MNGLVAVRHPTFLREVGVELPALLPPVIITEGDPAWSWQEHLPSLPIDTFSPPSTVPTAPGWGVDHVVITVPDLADGVAALVSVGADLRREGASVRGRRAAFLLAGPVIEVIEVPGRPARLAGIAFESDHDLDHLADRWSAAGIATTRPHPAAQPGRQIFSLTTHPVAVMSRRVAR